MTISFLTFIILALGCYRATHLIVFDKVFEPIRNLFVVRFPLFTKEEGWTKRYELQGGPFRRQIGLIMNCPWCASFYVSALILISYSYFEVYTYRFCLLLTFSAIASLLVTAWMKTVGLTEFMPAPQKIGIHPSKLVGKMVLRTEPHRTTGDRSFLHTPITILAVSESHILFRWEGEFGKHLSNPEVPRILGSDYIDENWTSYDDLMKLAEPSFLAKIGKWFSSKFKRKAAGNQ